MCDLLSLLSNRKICQIFCFCPPLWVNFYITIHRSVWQLCLKWHLELSSYKPEAEHLWKLLLHVSTKSFLCSNFNFFSRCTKIIFLFFFVLEESLDCWPTTWMLETKRNFLIIVNFRDYFSIKLIFFFFFPCHPNSNNNVKLWWRRSFVSPNWRWTFATCMHTTSNDFYRI